MKKSLHSSDSPLVSIVILNWNGADDTIRCVESVKKQSYDNIEIIVMDNGSDNDLERLSSLDKRLVKLIFNKKNLGFAGGHASALPYCKGEFIFILNNDALVEKNSIKNAVKRMSLDDKIAVVGGRSYHLSDEGASSGFYSYQRIDPSTADVHTYGGDDGRAEDTVTVSGSAALIRRSVIDTVGYFDERFFAYYEETDLFALYLRAGYRIVYDPAVRIQHKDGASTRTKKYMYYYLMLKNQYLFAFKNFDTPHLRGFIKIHFRHFLRSLWLYAKDRSNVDTIHRARVRSSLWNWAHLLGTLASRARRLSVNKSFNYSTLLEEQQPLGCTLVVDVRSSGVAEIHEAVGSLCRFKPGFKEVLFISNQPYEMPRQPHSVSYRFIIDKGTVPLSQYEFGVMASNTAHLFFVPSSSLKEGSIASTARTITSLLRKIVSHEYKIILNTQIKSDFSLTAGLSSLIGIEKEGLVNFLSRDTSVVGLDGKTLSSYLAWLIVNCEPILKTDLHLSNKELSLNPKKTEYPILASRCKWLVKKTLRSLHLTRVVKKLGKLVARKSHEDVSAEVVSRPRPRSRTAIDAKYIASTPIFINLRDRVEPLAELIEWLEKSGTKNIFLIDNDSSYPPLIDYLQKTPYQVIELGRNGMHKAPWESFAIRFIAKNRHYIVSDPDIIPTKNSPRTTIKRMYDVLNAYSKIDKVGVALKIDDLPAHYSLRESVIQWESRFWEKSLQLESDLYQADVDTTLALYRPSTWWFLSPSARLAGKYSMRHEPWYQSLDSPTEDMLYYRARASSEVSTWVKGKLPKHHLRALKKEGLL